MGAPGARTTSSVTIYSSPLFAHTLLASIHQSKAEAFDFLVFTPQGPAPVRCAAALRDATLRLPADGPSAGLPAAWVPHGSPARVPADAGVPTHGWARVPASAGARGSALPYRCGPGPPPRYSE